MSIVVTTPTGNIGRPLTQALLDTGEKPVLIARDASKVEAFAAAGAEVREGSHDDPGFLTEATRGAQALFMLTPSSFQLQDIRAFYRKFAEAAATAITANNIPYTVHLSSVGADLESGNGPVAGLYAAEQVLNKTGKNVLHLRPGYFMENTLGQIPSILQAGSLFTTFPKGTTFPMIATRDIGERAAQLLLRRDWTGVQVMELQGHSETSYDEVAAVLSEVLDRKLSHVTVGADKLIESLMGMGASRVMAESLAELSEAITSERLVFHEPRNEKNTTPTAYPAFAQEVFRPTFEAASA